MDTLMPIPNKLFTYRVVGLVTYLLFIIGTLQKNEVFAQSLSPLNGKIICIDPGHGGTAKTDSYRQGPTGEREEWINLRVAFSLKQLLEQKGAKVVMTRTEDVFVPLANRANTARESHADLFLSIHHNATADSAVNFPIIYFHGHASENQAGVVLGKAIAKALREQFYRKETPVSLVSDHTIFASGGAAVLRGTYGIPAVLSEASFFTNPAEEHLLKDTTHNRQEAEAYLAALEAFFATPQAPTLEKNSLVSVSSFRGLQEAERMSEVARYWYADYTMGLELMQRSDTVSLHRAYDLFTRSARSFPDSYVAGKCHQNLAALLKQGGKGEEATEEEKRANEFYVDVNDKALTGMVIADSALMGKINRLATDIREEYAPDQRMNIFYLIVQQEKPLLIRLETTVPEAVPAFKAALNHAHVTATVTAQLLPDEQAGTKSYGIANLSVCNNRVKPGNQAELATQTLLGTPVRILKQERGYYLVRTPDQYLSWTASSGVAAMDRAGFEDWKQSKKVVYTAEFGHSYSEATEKSLPVSDLVHGVILQLVGKEKGFYKVVYPDRRIAYVPIKQMMSYEKWIALPNPTANQVLSMGKTLVGVPYLWGGTSIKGVDCSGFTKTCYFLNGIIIPRDASQQALVGEDVDVFDPDQRVNIDKCLQNLKPGDLLFFGRRRPDGSPAVTHTGIYMGNGEFIHSSGLVRINSMVKDRSNYIDLVERELVGAKNILNAIGRPGITRVEQHKWYAYR